MAIKSKPIKKGRTTRTTRDQAKIGLARRRKRWPAAEMVLLLTIFGAAGVIMTIMELLKIPTMRRECGVGRQAATITVVVERARATTAATMMTKASAQTIMAGEVVEGTQETTTPGKLLGEMTGEWEGGEAVAENHGTMMQVDGVPSLAIMEE